MGVKKKRRNGKNSSTFKNLKAKHTKIKPKPKQRIPSSAGLPASRNNRVSLPYALSHDLVLEFSQLSLESPSMSEKAVDRPSTPYPSGATQPPPIPPLPVKNTVAPERKNKRSFDETKKRPTNLTNPKTHVDSTTRTLDGAQDRTHQVIPSTPRSKCVTPSSNAPKRNSLSSSSNKRFEALLRESTSPSPAHSRKNSGQKRDSNGSRRDSGFVDAVSTRLQSPFHSPLQDNTDLENKKASEEKRRPIKPKKGCKMSHIPQKSLIPAPPFVDPIPKVGNSTYPRFERFEAPDVRGKEWVLSSSPFDEERLDLYSGPDAVGDAAIKHQYSESDLFADPELEEHQGSDAMEGIVDDLGNSASDAARSDGHGFAIIHGSTKVRDYAQML